jgi:hypothetical protein
MQKNVGAQPILAHSRGMSNDPSHAKIYYLEDPRNGALKYVGKTIQPLQQRLQQHVYPARVGKHNHPKAKWIRSVLADGHLPSIRLLEVVPYDQWRRAEREWATKFRISGADLTNDAPVGGGGERSHSGRMTQDAVAMLGNLPDSQVAMLVGLSTTAVRYHRKVRGIPRTGHSRQANPSRLKPTSFIDLLGKLPDDEIAALAGVTRKTVAYHRKRREILPCGNRPEKRTKPPYMGGHNRIALPEGALRRLGKEPDYQIATAYGVTKGVIARARKQANIAPYSDTTGNNGKFKKGNYPARWKHR